MSEIQILKSKLKNREQLILQQNKKIAEQKEIIEQYAETIRELDEAIAKASRMLR